MPAKAVCEEKNIQPHTVNLLGVTPLDFGAYSRAGYMKKIWKNGLEGVINLGAMGDDLEVLSHALEAEVNHVVSSVGLRTAKYLKRI